MASGGSAGRLAEGLARSAEAVLRTSDAMQKIQASRAAAWRAARERAQAGLPLDLLDFYWPLVDA